MRYVSLKGNVVDQIRMDPQDGFMPAPDHVSGGWILNSDGEFVVPEMSAEKKMSLLRMERNRLLSKTDWWAVQDRVMSQDEKDYRQALRNITETYSSLDDAVFPEMPS